MSLVIVFRPLLLLLCVALGACITGRDPGDPSEWDGGTGTIPGEWLNVIQVDLPVSFMMGSPPAELCRHKSYLETHHKVTLTHRFTVAATEVTQAQFKKVRGYNPSDFTDGGANRPVEQVNWHEAAAYCNQLSQIGGLSQCYSCNGDNPKELSCQTASAFRGGIKTIYHCPGYRLPTEAEWEYAYRAGTSGPLYQGTLTKCGFDTAAGAIAWYSGNSTYPAESAGTREVGLKAKNPWGLYDMAGNVYEWIHDYYKVDLGMAPVTDPLPTASDPGVYVDRRPLRGGGWLSDAEDLRAAARGRNVATTRNYDIGFRCVRTTTP